MVFCIIPGVSWAVLYGNEREDVSDNEQEDVSDNERQIKLSDNEH